MAATASTARPPPSAARCWHSQAADAPWTNRQFRQRIRHDEKDAHLGRENAAALRLLQAPAAPSPVRPTRPATSLLLPRPSSARLREPPYREDAPPCGRSPAPRH